MFPSSFEIFSTPHIIMIGVSVIAGFVLYVARNNWYPYRDVIRISFAVTLIVGRISLDIWYLSGNRWDVTHSLPFELCSISLIACAIMLLTNHKGLFEVFYFIAIGGAIQAILTPDLGYGFPNFRFFQFFIVHIILILSPLLMIWFFDYKVTLKSLIKSFLTLHVIAGFVYFINLALDANYMFLRHKPYGTSLLDVLGPYPYYLISLEVVALFLFFLLYFPFLATLKKNFS